MSNETIQGTHEWLERRKRSVTASDIAILMNESPYCTPYQLFEQKLGYRTIEETEAMREGTRLEPYARQKLQDLFKVDLNSLVCFHPEFSWQMASLDAVDDKFQFLTEIKSSKKYHELAKAGTIPAHVNSQMQWQMYVTGVNHMFLYCFDGVSGILIPIKRDNVYLEKAIEKAKEFYACLTSLEPPPLSPKDIVQREDHEWCNQAEKYQKAKNSRMFYEMQETLAKKKLLEMAGDSCAEGGGIKVTRYIRRGAINYADIRELDGVDLEKYRKEPTQNWRIT